MGKQSPRFEFVAAHRGGPITKDVHRNLVRWAKICAQHVLHMMEEPIDERLTFALQVCEDWSDDKVPTGVAMKASLGAHAVARTCVDPVAVAVARSIGHAVATAHMADHSLGAALYALKALKLAGKPLDAEREWQQKQLVLLPSEIVHLVQTTLNQKGKSFKLW